MHVCLLHFFLIDAFFYIFILFLLCFFNMFHFNYYMHMYVAQ